MSVATLWRSGLQSKYVALTHPKPNGRSVSPLFCFCLLSSSSSDGHLLFVFYVFIHFSLFSSVFCNVASIVSKTFEMSASCLQQSADSLQSGRWFELQPPSGPPLPFGGARADEEKKKGDSLAVPCFRGAALGVASGSLLVSVCRLRPLSVLQRPSLTATITIPEVGVVKHSACNCNTSFSDWSVIH